MSLNFSNLPENRLTVLGVGRSGHQRGGNGEQNLVSGIILGVIGPPQYLKHGLHNVGDVVLVIWGMALQLFMTFQ